MISCLIFLAAFGACYYFAPQIYGFLLNPYVMAIGPDEGKRLIYTGLTEAFFTYMKLAFWAAFCLCAPVFLSQIWLFMVPGLYKKEKRAILPFLVMTPVLFIAGAAFVYYFIFPLAWPFFLSFEMPNGLAGLGDQSVPLVLEARISEYLSLVMTLIFAFGISFELPILLILLAKLGIVSASTLIKGRKYAIVIMFIAAAVLTPPDIISQIALAVPLMILYEVSIFFAKRFQP